MSSPTSADDRTLTDAQIKGLQQSLGASITATQNSALQCPEKKQKDLLIAQAEDMSDQYDDLETRLFHLGTVQVSSDVGGAFDGTNDFANQLSAMTANLDQYSKILDLAGKVVSAATQLLKVLP